MDPGLSRYHLRKRSSLRRLHRDATSSESDSEDGLLFSIRPCYLKPWIVDLLLEYGESEDRPAAQYGQVLKVLSEASPHLKDGQDPAAVVYIADGRHYIQTVVPARAIQIAKDFPPQSGFSSILGQFIVLQNYRVCVKEAAKAEDSEFYFKLDGFRVTTMRRCATRQQDCNREPSVLQRIKELWLRGLALQPLPSTGCEPSVSEVLGEIKEDKLSALKRNVEECFSSLDPGKVLNSEQLAVYPETRWQAERKQDKMQCRDIFTVPAKVLVIGEEDEAALSSSYPPKPAHVASDSENSSDEDHSTVSFVSEAGTVDGSLEDPWDIFPGMTLTSSKEMSDTQPSLPNTQQMLLASTAEVEEAAGSGSCTPDGLQSCDPVLHCSSTQVEPAKEASPSLLSPYNNGANQESRSKALNSAHNATSMTPDTDGSIPCGQPLNNSHSQASMPGLSSDCPTIRTSFLSKTSFGNEEANHPAHSQREMVAVRGDGEKSLETCRKCGVAKRSEEESIGTSSRLLHSSCSDQNLNLDFPKPNYFHRRHMAKNQAAQKMPLKFAMESTPKKSRIDEVDVQPLQESARSRCAGRHLEKLKEQSPSTGRLADSHGGQLGAQQQERMRRAVSHHVYQPPTAELCSQVRSTRISRALLGWARWVCRNKQKL